MEHEFIIWISLLALNCLDVQEADLNMPYENKICEDFVDYRSGVTTCKTFQEQYNIEYYHM